MALDARLRASRADITWRNRSVPSGYPRADWTSSVPLADAGVSATYRPQLRCCNLGPYSKLGVSQTSTRQQRGYRMRRARHRSDQQMLNFEPTAATARGAPIHAGPGETSAVPIAILRLPQVCRVTGLCRSLIYELEASGSFPARVTLGKRSVGWVESEIQCWLSNRLSARHMTTAAVAPNRATAGTNRDAV